MHQTSRERVYDRPRFANSDVYRPEQGRARRRSVDEDRRGSGNQSRGIDRESLGSRDNGRDSRNHGSGPTSPISQVQRRFEVQSRTTHNNSPVMTVQSEACECESVGMI